jgi:DNA-binding CsgD family transcriptional regulator
LRIDADLYRQLEGRSLIAFPVKLGGGSDGAMIFAGWRLNLDIVQLLDLHRRAHGVFKALLGLDLEKSAPRQHLNDRELECLQLAGEGLKSELIAQRLKLSVHTVNAYLSTATAKLDSVNRIQAIAKAIRLGYLA